MDKKILSITLATIGLLIALIAVFMAIGVKTQKETSDLGAQSGGIISIESIGVPLNKQDPSLPTLEMFYDYTCYHCAVAENNLGEFIFENAGEKFNVLLQPVLTVGQPFTYYATDAVLIVSQEDPENLAAFHSALMAYSLSEMESGNSAVLSNEKASFEKVKEIAEKTGVSKQVIASFPESPSDYLSYSTDSWVNREDIVRVGSQLGTPEFILDGTPVVRESVDPKEDLASFEKNF